MPFMRRSEDNLQVLFSFFHHVGLEIKLELSGLLVSAFVHHAILLAFRVCFSVPLRLEVRICFHIYHNINRSISICIINYFSHNLLFTE